MTSTSETEASAKRANVTHFDFHQATTQTPDAANLVPLLLSLTKNTRNLTQLKLRELGFYNGHDELLVALNEETPITVSHLALTLTVRPSTVSKMLDGLAAQGLVTKFRNSNDGRLTLVKITSTGLDARSQLLEMRRRLEDQLLSGLGEGADLAQQELAKLAVLVRSCLMRLR